MAVSVFDAKAGPTRVVRALRELFDGAMSHINDRVFSPDPALPS